MSWAGTAVFGSFAKEERRAESLGSDESSVRYGVRHGAGIGTRVGGNSERELVLWHLHG